MSAPLIIPIGREAQPVIVIDDFVQNAEALRKAASRADFGPAAHHYPGIRASLPDDYLPAALARLQPLLGPVFGRRGAIETIDASFSIVTTPAASLSVAQRLPHCDAFGADRIAMVHYLATGDAAGTAFYRHRSTGFETIDDQRAPIYFDQLDAELRHGGFPAASYAVGDTALFEQTHRIEAPFNRAVVYRSYLLHSGVIPPDAALSADPASGRLTVTAFLSAARD